MPRKLIPLTDELHHKQSVSKLKTWESNVSAPEGEENAEKNPVVRKKSKKILSMISLWGGGKASKKSEGKSGKKFEIFSTKKVSKDAKTAMSAKKKAEEEIKDNAAMKGNEMKKPQNVKISNKINYANGKNISLESFKPSSESDDDLKPKPPSKSPSHILTHIPTKNYLNLIKPKTGIILIDEEKSKKCEEITFDPREKQKMLDGNPVKVFKRGEDFFVKINDNLEEKTQESSQRKEIATCRRAINVKLPQLNLLTPVRRVSTFDMSLGKPFGIQLGSHNILNETKTKDLKGIHALDVVLVAHGLTHYKHPVYWKERDIDEILITGEKMYSATKDIQLDRLSDCVKGFTFNDNYIEVKVTEPIIIGKILTLTERSMDLYNGLCKYFHVYRQGIFETMRTTLYIIHEDGHFYVFDPRGRNEVCERDDNREAAIMLLMTIDNVYHLILNMSKINTRAPFKISNVKMTKCVSKEHVKEEFTASCSGKISRNSDYGIVNENIAVLIGNLSLNSNFFNKLRNRFGLAASIMTMIYAKIDPAVSWSKTTLDNILHFGYQMHKDCLNDEEEVRNIQLSEIPSKFYVGDSYCAQIAIAAYVQRAKLTKTRFLFSNPITVALVEGLKAFRCLLLEVDNYSFAVWRSESASTLFLFDAYQKSVGGQIDHFDGAAVVLMFHTIDHFCENVIQRLLAIPSYESSELKLHGMKINELKRLSKKHMKDRPRLKLASNKCIRPFTADDARQFQDVPSTIDSVAPKLTKEQQLKLPEKKLAKPLHQTITDLNSPSLLCFKKRAYEEIMASVERKLSLTKQPGICNETIEIMKEIYSEMLHKIDGSEQQQQHEVKSKVNLSQSAFSTCGEFVGVAERVLLKTDLECLERERDEMMRKLKNPSDETIDSKEEDEEELTLSKEKLVKSHYHELPDKTQIIRGTKSLFALPLDPNMFDYENFSILIAISAILTSTKYSIATWSTEIIDYILGCGQIMANSLKLENRMDFYTNDEHNLPKIHINDKFYNLKMTAIANGKFNQLENYLNEILADIDRVLMVTTCGSLAVFKRKNFHYLFEYATCNMVGYRIRNGDFGASCVMRFDSLHGLVRRIHANHSDVKDAQKFVIYRVIVEDSSKDDKRSFIPFSASQEKIIIDALRHNRMTRRDDMIRKLKETDAKVREEKERLRNYRDATGVTEISSEILAHTDFDETQLPTENDYELDLSAYDSNTMATDDDDDVQRPLYESSWNELQRQIGYDIDDSKIRGTFGYANRTSDDNKLRACHFASAYAIIYAIHHPFEQMNYRCVDVILENGVRIYDSLDIENYAEAKELSEIIVDKVSYELKIEEFSKEPMSLELETFTEFFGNGNFGAVIENDNCSMAVVKTASNYHIFDPYDANDIAKESSKIENPIASWSLHKNLDSVVEYLKNCLKPTSTIRLHRVAIVTSKKLKSKTGYFLFSTPTSPSSTSMKACSHVDLKEDEKIEWISMTSVIPWSRLEHYNADGVKRYTRDSQWKEYDIEMSQKLFSLWGNIHPNMKLFGLLAGKQHLACCVVALIMSNMYNIDEWDSVLLDSICTHGHKYLVDMISKLEETKRHLEVSDLNGLCRIQNFDFNVELELIIFGKLYEANRKYANLNRALEYVFEEKKLPGVILICNERSLAIGNVKNETYFMYDSQSYGAPLFDRNQGTTYVLKCCCMKILLNCIILTLNVKQHNVKFHLFAAKSKMVTATEEEDKISDEKQIDVEDEIEKIED